MRPPEVGVTLTIVHRTDDGRTPFSVHVALEPRRCLDQVSGLASMLRRGAELHLRCDDWDLRGPGGYDEAWTAEASGNPEPATISYRLERAARMAALSNAARLP